MNFGARNLIRIFICCMVGVILVSGGWSANASDKHRMGMTVEEAAAALESGVSEIRLPVSEQETMLREIFGRYPALGYAYDGIEGTVRTGVACLRVSLREIGSERVAVIAEQDAFMRLVSEAMLRAEPSVHLVIRRTDANAWDYEKMLCEIERNEVLGRSYLSHHAWRKWKQPYTDDVYVQIQFGYTGPRTDIIEKKMTVALRGPAADLMKITAEDITVRADFKDAVAGTSTFNATVHFGDEFSTIGAIRSYSVTANILEKE